MKINVTKKKKSLLALLIMLVIAMLPQRSYGQVFETRSGVDTLSLSERISIHTNVVDWGLMVPNIGLEFDVKQTNWNRWAVGFSLRTRWQTNSTFKQRYFYSLTEGRVYWRNYWRTRQINPRRYVEPHTGLIDKAFSCRRTRVKHPTTTWYRGLYASASKYSYKMSKYGHQGIAVSGGVTYGCIKPLFQFASGNSIDLEMGIDVGLVLARDEKFALDDDDKCYTRASYRKVKMVPFPVPTEARLGLVYRLGDYPITKKYRWRQDVDMAYLDTLIAERTRRENDARVKANNMEMRQNIEKDFWSVYDSVANLNAIAAKKLNAEMAKKKAEEERLAAEKLRQQKAEAKLQKAQKADSKTVPADSTATMPADTTGIKVEPADTTGVTAEPTDTTGVTAEPTDTTTVSQEGSEQQEGSVSAEASQESTESPNEAPATEEGSEQQGGSESQESSEMQESSESVDASQEGTENPSEPQTTEEPQTNEEAQTAEETPAAEEAPAAEDSQDQNEGKEVTDESK